MTEVFIVLIGSKKLHPNTRVGPVYFERQDAVEEVERLRTANSFTDAWWISRQAGDPHREHFVELNRLCDKLSQDLNELIEGNRDSHACDEAISIACKLFDAIRDIEECKWHTKE